MVLNPMIPDLLVTCPLDESHRILKSRLQFHLVRCLKNNKLEEKIKCPWNPLHIIDKFAYEDHCRNKCEDVSNTMGSVAEISMGIKDADKSNNDDSVTSSVADAKLPPIKEDWDADPYCGTYDPVKSSESKLILRSSIGLSKAKKKEFRNQERLRHQQLEKIAPIQTRSLKTNVIEKDSCRPPHNSGIALSASASRLGQSSTSRISTDEIEETKWPMTLRAPHSRSEGLNFTPDDTISVRSCDQTRSIFDETFGSESEHVYGGSSFWLANEMQELERRQVDSDARSCASGTSTSSSRIAGLRKFLNQTGADAAKNNDAASTSGMKKNAKMAAAKLQLHEAASVSSIEPTNSQPSPLDEDSVHQLTQLLADLESKEKKLQEKKAEIIAQLPKISGNIETRKKNRENGDDSASSNDSSLVKTQNGRLNEFSKCAANFSNFRKSENLPVIGIGRGSIVDFHSFKNRKPGTSFEKEITEPFA